MMYLSFVLGRSCNFPGGRPHAYLQPTNLEFGSVATFQCEEGYHVQPGVTSFNITCQADGTWSNSLMCVGRSNPLSKRGKEDEDMT